MSKARGPFDALRKLRGQLPDSKVPQRKIVPAPKSDSPADDAKALAQLRAGATPLPPINLAELHVPPPPPVPRQRTKDENEPAAEVDKPRLLNPDALPEHWFQDEPALPAPDALKAALRGVRPLVTDKVLLEPPKPSPRPLQHEADERAALHESIFAPTSLDLRLEGGDELAYLRVGMPQQTLRDLRRGRWIVEGAVDLHGCNRDEAREVLAAFMGQCRKQGQRCVRVIHGKGLGSPGKEPVLKGLVAGWLINYDDVLAYCQARVHDGGAGALMVLLKAQRR